MSITTNVKISRLYKIKDFCIVGDGAHTSIKRQSSGIMYLTSKNFKPSGLELSTVDFISESDYIKYFGSSKKALITPLEGDVLFGIIGSLGVPCVVKKNDVFGISSSVAILRPQQGLMSKYLYYFMTSSVFQGAIEAIKSGVAQSFLSLDMIRSLPLIVPSNLEQERISAILSAYDDLIENNDRRITLLEKMAEEIYREWFVRLRFPGFDRATFHKGIPEGWEVVTLGGLADITSSKRIYAEDYVQDGIPFYRSKEIIQKASNIEITEPLFISHEKFQGIKTRFGVPQEGDILITSVGTLGISYFVKENDCFYFKDGNLIWFKKNDNCTNKYLYSWMKSEQGINSLLETSIGTSQAAFTIVNLKKISIIKPSKAMLEKFVSFIDPIDSQKEKLSGSIQNLKQTRDRLLTRLISGKLSVEDLDIQFPPSMTTDS
jgi:type I restriction enzyme, S subunit